MLEGLSWSHDEAMVAYPVEPIQRPLAQPFFQNKAKPIAPRSESSGTEAPSDKSRTGKQYIFEDDYGELMDGIRSPQIAIFDIEGSSNGSVVSCHQLVSDFTPLHAPRPNPDSKDSGWFQFLLHTSRAARWAESLFSKGQITYSNIRQPVWSPVGYELAFTTFEETSRRMGLVFCRNRKSAIFTVAVQPPNKRELSGQNETSNN